MSVPEVVHTGVARTTYFISLNCHKHYLQKDGMVARSVVHDQDAHPPKDGVCGIQRQLFHECFQCPGQIVRPALAGHSCYTNHQPGHACHSGSCRQQLDNLMQQEQACPGSLIQCMCLVDTAPPTMCPATPVACQPEAAAMRTKHSMNLLCSVWHCSGGCSTCLRPLSGAWTALLPKIPQLLAMPVAPWSFARTCSWSAQPSLVSRACCDQEQSGCVLIEVCIHKGMLTCNLCLSPQHMKHEGPACMPCVHSLNPFTDRLLQAGNDLGL